MSTRSLAQLEFYAVLAPTLSLAGIGMHKPDVLAAIEAIYDAALDAGRWAHALDSLSQSVGGVGATIVPIGGDAAAPTITSENLLEANAAYQATWWQHDTPTRRLAQRGLKAGSVGTDRIVMDEEEVRKDPFYQEFLRSYGIGQSVAAITSFGEGRLLSIAVQRDIKSDLFQQSHVDTMAILAPHLGRAVSIALSIAHARKASGDLSGALERLNCGVMMLGSDGCLRSMNDSAANLLGDGLTISHKRPHAVNRQDDVSFQQAIRSALPDAYLSRARTLLLRSAKGGWPLHIEIVPLRPSMDLFEAAALSAGGVMLLIRSLAPRPRDISQHLRELGLSLAEARLAQSLGAGKTLREVADAHAVTYETARSHLKTVFGKLGVHRQADLVALLTRLTAAL